MQKPQQVSKEQVLEWLENPVTLAFKYFAQLSIEEIEGSRGLDVYIKGDPQATQENMAQLNGEYVVWQDVIEALEGEGLEEQIRD